MNWKVLTVMTRSSNRTCTDHLLGVKGSFLVVKVPHSVSLYLLQLYLIPWLCGGFDLIHHLMACGLCLYLRMHELMPVEPVLLAIFRLT